MLLQCSQRMALSDRWGAIRKNSFVRAVTLLAGGTALAQGITVAVLPVLTRLYKPEDFSVLAAYASLLAIFSVIACLRLEIAIPLPESDEDAANLLAISLISAVAFGLLLFCLIGIWNFWLAGFFERGRLGIYMWLLAPAVWLASTYSALQFWATRKKNFKTVARTRITQASFGAGTQLGMGWLHSGPLGLLVGHAISSGAGVYKLARDFWVFDRPMLEKVSWTNAKRLLKTYERFPRFSVLESLANNAGIHLPMLIIASLSLGPEAGYLLLAMRATAIPLSLIGGAVAQVYLSNAAIKYRDGELRQFTAGIFGGLLRTGVGPLLFIGIVAQTMCPIILGSNWERVGVLIGYMTPWVVFQFLASPISMVMHITGRQRGMLILTVLGLLLRVGAVLFAVKYDLSRVAFLYAAFSAIFYLVCNFVFLKAAGVMRKDIPALIGRSAPSLLAWPAMGILLVYVLGKIN